MFNRTKIRRILIAAAGSLIGPVIATASATAQPANIRLGTGGAAAENLWLMDTPGGLTPGRGTAYNFDFAYFRNASDRIKGYEAGQLDCLTGTPAAIIFAASKDIDFRVLASVSKESRKGAVVEYRVREDSPIRAIADLKDKVMGNTGFKSATELQMRLVLIGANLNPDRDVRMTVVGFAQMADALAANKVDLGTFAEPFAAAIKTKGGTRLLFTSKDVLPFDEDLINFFCSSKFVAQHGDSLRAFLADFVATTKFYVANLRTARQHLIDARKTLIEPAVFLDMPDQYRDPECRSDIESWNKVQDAMIRVGFQQVRIDPAKFVDNSYLPGGRS